MDGLDVYCTTLTIKSIRIFPKMLKEFFYRYILTCIKDYRGGTDRRIKKRMTTTCICASSMLPTNTVACCLAGTASSFFCSSAASTRWNCSRCSGWFGITITASLPALFYRSLQAYFIDLVFAVFKSLAHSVVVGIGSIAFTDEDVLECCEEEEKYG